MALHDSLHIFAIVEESDNSYFQTMIIKILEGTDCQGGLKLPTTPMISQPSSCLNILTQVIISLFP